MNESDPKTSGAGISAFRQSEARSRAMAAYIQQRRLDFEIRRRMKRRHFRREVLPYIVWGLACGASIGWLTWTIWG